MSFCLIILAEVIAIDLGLKLANPIALGGKSLIEINIIKAKN